MTIWVPELDRSKPLYLAIADSIGLAVASGALSKGQRLPPQRDLAWKLGVTLGTVTRAYKQAELRGLLSGEVGRGSFVRTDSTTVVTAMAERGGEMLDLSQATPPPTVSTAELDAALSHVTHDPNRLALLDYTASEGLPAHRAMMVQWLKRSGIEAQEKDVFVTPGAHSALAMTLDALQEQQTTVLAEDINYAHLNQLFRRARLETVALPMDENGLLPDALEAATLKNKARLLYLVPTLQNPTTHTMGRQRREDIVAVARKHDLTIIEDDIFRLLDERVQPPTLYSLAPERTYHISSLSKTLAPGLRIGFVLTPQGQDRTMRAHVRSMAPRTAALTGEVARFWIEGDMASTILARTRAELGRRRQGFLEIFRDCRFSCAPGAPYAWLELPGMWTGSQFAAAALSQNIKISPGSIFELGARGKARNHVRICFGAPGSLGQSLRAFESLRELMRHPPEDDFTPVA
jgi:DNA-binding transcriptional MocR family regulator